MFANPLYTFQIAKLDEMMVGFAIIARIAEDAALLEYLAVDGTRRHAGVGRRLFLESAAPRCVGRRALLIETESAEPGAPDFEHCLRRHAFYRGLGCHVLSGLVYRMPRVAEDEPLPMNVWLFASDPPPAVAKARLRNWLQCIYVTVYGRPRHDPAIDAMLSSLPEAIPLS
jgi:hypothetical protein